jgi:hypothetical protein
VSTIREKLSPELPRLSFRNKKIEIDSPGVTTTSMSAVPVKWRCELPAAWNSWSM